jgi:putative flippase GtrA
MTANSFPGSELAEMQMREAEAKSWQAADTKTVASDGLGENLRKSEHERLDCAANSSLDNGMPVAGRCAANSELRKILAVSDLRGSEGTESDDKTEKSSRSLIAPSTLLRWCKFNLVGGMGIIVQFAALFFLRSVMHFNYLFATAIAVEAAVVHNFVWHEQFTWVDRAKVDRIISDRTIPDRTTSDRTISDRGMSCRRSLLRLVRFNLTTGAVSILGNLALMKVMVGQGHINYLLANAVAIALCSLANFLVSETWVFQRE